MSCLAHNIVAKCPGLAGTVPEFRPMSRLCPGWHKCPRIFTNLELRVAKIPCGPSICARASYFRTEPLSASKSATTLVAPAI